MIAAADVTNGASVLITVPDVSEQTKNKKNKLAIDVSSINGK